MKNYYQILAIDSNAKFEDIRRAYRNLAKKYHPDVNNQNPLAVQQFQEIQEAYSILSHSSKKQLYDYQWNIYQNPPIQAMASNQSNVDWQIYEYQQKVNERYKKEQQKLEKKLNQRAILIAFGIVFFIILSVSLTISLGKHAFGIFLATILFIGIMLTSLIWRLVIEFNNLK